MIPNSLSEKIELSAALCAQEASERIKEVLTKLCEAAYQVGHAQGMADASRKTSPAPEQEDPNGQRV